MTRDLCRVTESAQGEGGREIVPPARGTRRLVLGGANNEVGLILCSILQRLGGCMLGDREGGDTRVDMVRTPELWPGSEMLRLKGSFKDSLLFTMDSLSMVRSVELWGR